MAYVPIANGETGLSSRNKINGIGTGLDTHIATSGSNVHGLGTMSTQNSDDVHITKGTMTNLDASGIFTGILIGSASGSAVLTEEALAEHISTTGSNVHGLGTISTQDADSVNITGGTISNTNFLSNISTKSVDYEISGTDSVVLANAEITLTLPDATLYTGKQYIIKRINLTGNVTIIGSSSQTIDNDSDLILMNQYDAVTLISNGSNWFII